MSCAVGSAPLQAEVASSPEACPLPGSQQGRCCGRAGSLGVTGVQRQLKMGVGWRDRRKYLSWAVTMTVHVCKPALRRWWSSLITLSWVALHCHLWKEGSCGPLGLPGPEGTFCLVSLCVVTLPGAPTLSLWSEVPEWVAAPFDGVRVFLREGSAVLWQASGEGATFLGKHHSGWFYWERALYFQAEFRAAFSSLVLGPVLKPTWWVFCLQEQVLLELFGGTAGPHGSNCSVPTDTCRLCGVLPALDK